MIMGGNQRLEYVAVGGEGASMRPPMIMGGNDAPVIDAPVIVPRFNEAAHDHGRKCPPCCHSSISGTTLQ